MRVIAGTHRGRRLSPPPAGVRPTTDRVRESIFARLPPLQGARVLDLFCGTGALGIESLSRGAEAVVFVDRSGRSLATTRRNLDLLQMTGAGSVIRAEATAALSRLARAGASFDLVFLDPPYATGAARPSAPDLLSRTLELLGNVGILHGDSLVVAESPKRHDLTAPSSLVVEDAREYGDTRVTWLRPAVGDDPDPTPRDIPEAETESHGEA